MGVSSRTFALIDLQATAGIHSFSVEQNLPQVGVATLKDICRVCLFEILRFLNYNTRQLMEQKCADYLGLSGRKEIQNFDVTRRRSILSNMHSVSICRISEHFALTQN